MMSDGMYLAFGKDELYHVPSITISVKGGCDNQEGTLLVGDFTWNFHYEKYCLMVTDVLCVGEKVVSTLPFSRRLDRIRDDVINQFRKKYSPKEQVALPIVLLGKEFFPVEKMDKLIGYVEEYEDHEEPSGYRYIYQNAKRYNDTVGYLIISESSPFFSANIKQWKWPRINTTNFHMKLDNSQSLNRCDLYLKVQNKLVFYREAMFSSVCKEKLLGALGDKTEATIECIYRGKTLGEWEYQKIGRDTEITNLEQLFSNLESHIHTITKNDLIKAFHKRKTQARKDSPPEVVYESPYSEVSPIPLMINHKRKLESPEQSQRPFKKPRLSHV
eukprot:TRINITY_DN3416_c0_g1_i2.p1 TRINITY_DN3416_c0_g1~~TRINITY_DN3416_c0_g1_i2.p1  ORF type:complete len:330 (-),score=57.76 TRINITY_DN3416_c0_g1_i2:53-1042(-)